jgi:hypothetical protein
MDFELSFGNLLFGYAAQTLTRFSLFAILGGR